MQRLLRLQKPLILYEKNHTLQDLTVLKKKWPIRQTTDIYEQQLEELFAITQPQLVDSREFEDRLQRFKKIRCRLTKKGSFRGNWIYFPWSELLLHMVQKEEYQALRTNRNRNLITAKEQQKLHSTTVGIVGLSVGNTIAMNLVYNGIGDTMKLAEHDSLETSNLNRVRARIDQVGTPKIDITAQQIYEVNPYATLHLYSKGLSKRTLTDFVNEDPKPRIIFESVDDFDIKIRLRLEARTAGIPVIMLTNLGDSVLIDVERYDQEKTLPIFNGLIGNIAETILEKPITEKDKQRYAVQIVGIENVPKRALQSIKQIRKTLVGRPQLMNTTSIAGGIAGYLARQILLNQPLPSGRKILQLSKTI